MKRPTAIPLILFCVATLLVDMAMGAARLYEPPMLEPGHLPAFLVIGATFGQISVVVAWAGVSRHWLLVRLAVVIVAVLLAAFPGSWCTTINYGESLGLFAVYGLLLGLPCGIAKIMGYRVDREASDIVLDTSLHARRGQYSLATLVSWMTAIAVVLGAMRLFDYPLQHGFELIAFCIANAGMTMLALGATLAKRRWWVWLAALVAWLPAVSFVMPWIESGRLYWIEAGIFGIVFATAATFILGWGFAVRLAGFRLCRRMFMEQS